MKNPGMAVVNITFINIKNTNRIYDKHSTQRTVCAGSPADEP